MFGNERFSKCKFYINMKKLTSYINEDYKISHKTKNQKLKSTNNNSHLWNEIQNEQSNNGEYHTYSFHEGVIKFNKGFIAINTDEEFAVIEAYNDFDDFKNDFNLDDMCDINELDIGESTEYDDMKFIRIW